LQTELQLNIERILSILSIDHRNSSILAGVRTICPLDYLLLQICRWPVNNTWSG